MAKKFKKLLLNLMCFFMILNMLGLGNFKVLANNNSESVKLTELTVSPENISHANAFRIEGKFAGKKVSENEILRIPIAAQNTKISVSGAKEIKNHEGIHIADAIFTNEAIEIKFTKEASNLQDIQGSFLVDGQAFALDLQQSSQGTIVVGDDVSVKKTINFNYTKAESGDRSSSVYYKTGDSQQTSSDKVRWGFVLNAAKKHSNGQAKYEISDTLDNTMVWDIDGANSEQYVVSFEYDNHQNPQWYNLADAKNHGIDITFTDNKTLKITASGNELDGRTVSIHLNAKLTQETINNTSIKKVRNDSTVNLNMKEQGWTIRDNEYSAEAEIFHIGADGDGNNIPKPPLPPKDKAVGKFILKKLNELKKPLADAEFSLESTDENNKHKQVKKSDGKEDGIIFDNIPEGEYTLKETSAPNGYKKLEDYYRIKVDKNGITIPTYISANAAKPQPRIFSAINTGIREVKTSGIVDVSNYSFKPIVNREQKEGLPTVWVTSGDFIELAFELNVKNDVNPGDSFTIQLDNKLSPTGIREKFLPPVPLKANDGSIVARGEYNEANNTFTYTFTDYIRTHKNVHIKVDYRTFGPDAKKILTSGANTFTNIIDNQKQEEKKLFIDYGETKHIMPGINNGLKMRHNISLLDRVNGLVERVVYLNSGNSDKDWVTYTLPNQYLELQKSANSQIKSVDIYLVPQNKKSTHMADSMPGLVDGLEKITTLKVEDLTNGNKGIRFKYTDFYDKDKKGNYAGLLFKIKEKLFDRNGDTTLNAKWGYKYSYSNSFTGSSVEAAASAVENNAQSNAEGEIKNPTISIINERENKTFSIKIRKQDAQDSNKGLNAKFKLYNEAGTQVIVDEVQHKNQEGDTSNGDNTLTFENIKAGRYTLKEEAAPQGYTAIPDIKLEITADGKTKLLNNNPMVELKDTAADKVINLIIKNQKNFNIKILKVDGENINQGLKATFALYEKDGKKLVQDKKETSGPNHDLIFENLKPGDYVIKEEIAPNGYRKIKDIKIKVDEYGKVTLANHDSKYVDIKEIDKNSTITLTVKNFKSSLPATGGPGDLLYYIFGSLIMIISIKLNNKNKYQSYK